MSIEAYLRGTWGAELVLFIWKGDTPHYLLLALANA